MSDVRAKTGSDFATDQTVARDPIPDLQRFGAILSWCRSGRCWPGAIY